MLNQTRLLSYIKQNLGFPFQFIELKDEEILSYVEEFTLREFSHYFPDSNTGYIVGHSPVSHGVVLTSTNGGAQWTNQAPEAQDTLYSTFFTDKNTGYAVGSLGTILKTTDGGVVWTRQTSGTTNILQSVFFVNRDTGYVVGWYGTILKTTNAGTVWTSQASGTSNNLCSVYFINAEKGYAVGWYGTILKTINGGALWTSQSSGTVNYLYSVVFTDTSTGYIAGGFGLMLKTTNGGYPYGTDELPGNSTFLRIYPNPSSYKIAVETSEIPATGQISIYNVSAQELIKRTIITASTQIDISTLPGGIYLVKLQGARSVQTGKLIKE